MSPALAVNTLMVVGAVARPDGLCRTLMGNCSLPALMNNGGKAARGGVQTPSPFGRIFPPPQEFQESFTGRWRLKEP